MRDWLRKTEASMGRNSTRIVRTSKALGALACRSLIQGREKTTREDTWRQRVEEGSMA